MNIDKENVIGSILDSISRIDYIRPEEIPNIALYMDHLHGRPSGIFQAV